MAKSRARKIREKKIREGRMDPAKNRGFYALADLRTRKSKTKQEVLYQDKYGELSSIDKNQTDDGSFCLGSCKMTRENYLKYCSVIPIPGHYFT